MDSPVLNVSQMESHDMGTLGMASFKAYPCGSHMPAFVTTLSLVQPVATGIDRVLTDGSHTAIRTPIFGPDLRHSLKS